MQLLVTDPGNGGSIAEIEDDFHDSLGNNVLFMKRIKAINLPNGVDNILQISG